VSIERFLQWASRAAGAHRRVRPAEVRRAGNEHDRSAHGRIGQVRAGLRHVRDASACARNRRPLADGMRAPLGARSHAPDERQTCQIIRIALVATAPCTAHGVDGSSRLR
jgi:hypothetical protein